LRMANEREGIRRGVRFVRTKKAKERRWGRSAKNAWGTDLGAKGKTGSKKEEADRGKGGSGGRIDRRWGRGLMECEWRQNTVIWQGKGKKREHRNGCQKRSESARGPWCGKNREPCKPSFYMGISTGKAAVLNRPRARRRSAFVKKGRNLSGSPSSGKENCSRRKQKGGGRSDRTKKERRGSFRSRKGTRGSRGTAKTARAGRAKEKPDSSERGTTEK